MGVTQGGGGRTASETHNNEVGAWQRRSRHNRKEKELQQGRRRRQERIKPAKVCVVRVVPPPCTELGGDRGPACVLLHPSGHLLIQLVLAPGALRLSLANYGVVVACPRPCGRNCAGSVISEVSKGRPQLHRVVLADWLTARRTDGRTDGRRGLTPS